MIPICFTLFANVNRKVLNYSNYFNISPIIIILTSGDTILFDIHTPGCQLYNEHYDLDSLYSTSSG